MWILIQIGWKISIHFLEFSTNIQVFTRWIICSLYNQCLEKVGELWNSKIPIQTNFAPFSHSQIYSSITCSDCAYRNQCFNWFDYIPDSYNNETLLTFEVDVKIVGFKISKVVQTSHTGLFDPRFISLR